MSGAFISALISETVNRLMSALTAKFRKHSVQELLDRLEMAQIEIESALRESEEFDINNDEPLHQWRQKLKEALCEAKEARSNFQAKILHEEPNQTIEGGSSARDQQMKEEGSDDATLVHTASNLREAVTRQVDLEANLPNDPFMQEVGSDDPTLVHTASNLREAVTHQVDLEANLPNDPFMQEVGSDDPTLVHTASNLREAVTYQVDLEANLPKDPFMQEEGSDDATLVHLASNLREAIARQVNLEANLPHDPFAQEEGSDDATLVHPASNLRETLTRHFDLEKNLPPDPSMQEEGSDDATLVHPGSHLRETVPRQVDQEANLAHDQPMQEEGSDDASSVDRALNLLEAIRKINLKRVLADYLLIQALVQAISKQCNFLTCSVKRIRFPFHFLAATDPSYVSARVLKSRKLFLGEYLENDKNVSKLKNTVEKLEKMTGNHIGNFIKLLKLQKKRKMSRKRKRSGVALQGFFLVLSLKLQAYALFFYGEDPHLLVIKLFCANRNVPTGITGDIFIGFIMKSSWISFYLP